MRIRTAFRSSLPESYRTWLAATLEGGTAQCAQHPAEELLAEHHLMRAVLAAMGEEAARLMHHQPLRPILWGRVVDFIGNFTHRVHRVKEEQLLFPALSECGLVEEDHFGRLERQHGQLHDLTVQLCNGVSEGDWESTLRVVGRYAALMGPHLDEEEEKLLALSVRRLDADRLAEIRRGFDSLEAEFLPPEGRLHYLEVARALCEDTAVDYPLDERSLESRR